MRVLVVSGLSGAGKSTALAALEDLDYYCVDNLPVRLIPQLMEVVAEERQQQAIGESVAIGIDARTPDDLERFPHVVGLLEGQGHQVDVLFLEAPKPTLLRRYSETRRRHPLGELPDAIEREIKRLQPIRRASTVTLNTERSTSRELRQLVRDRYGQGGALTLTLMSFGFKNGLPSEADLVLDARFLGNPFDYPELRPQSGLDAPVSDFVLSQPAAAQLLEQIEGLVRFQAPKSLKEGRTYLTVAIGCTGGQHRSVALVEELARRFGDPVDDPSPSLVVRHRDVQRKVDG